MCWIKRSTVDVRCFVFSDFYFLRRNVVLLIGYYMREMEAYDINARLVPTILQEPWKNAICCEYVESLVLLRKERGSIPVSAKQSHSNSKMSKMARIPQCLPGCVSWRKSKDFSVPFLLEMFVRVSLKSLALFRFEEVLLGRAVHNQKEMF